MNTERAAEGWGGGGWRIFMCLNCSEGKLCAMAHRRSGKAEADLHNAVNKS